MTLPRFILAGALNTAMTYLAYLGLLYFIPYAFAYSVSYILGIASGYLLNSLWVFKQQLSIKTATTYPLVFAINYILGLTLLWLLVTCASIPKEIAPLLTLFISVPVMFCVTRLILQPKPTASSTINL